METTSFYDCKGSLWYVLYFIWQRQWPFCQHFECRRTYSLWTVIINWTIYSVPDNDRPTINLLLWVKFDSPFPSITQDYSHQFLLLEHCLQIARPAAHTPLPQYLRYTIVHASRWRLIMHESDLSTKQPDGIRSIASQVFIQMERAHDLSPIPFPSRFSALVYIFIPQ